MEWKLSCKVKVTGAIAGKMLRQCVDWKTRLCKLVILTTCINCANSQSFEICELQGLPEECTGDSLPIKASTVTVSIDLPTTPVYFYQDNLTKNFASELLTPTTTNPFPSDDVLVQKEVLLPGALPPPIEKICTVDDELHEFGTNPLCSRIKWILDDNEAEVDVENVPRTRRAVVGQRVPLTPEEKQQLQRLYGDKFNVEAAEAVKAMGMALETRRSYQSPPHRQMRQQSQYRSQQNQRQPYRTFQRMNRRFERQAYTPPRDYQTDNGMDSEDECSLYGTWMSKLAGVAIELQPVNQGGVDVILQDLPQAKSRFISSTWTGSVMLSPISPDTITLIFQETGSSAPSTAVFTGQCVYCNGGNAIQGSWVIFSGQKQCLPGMTPVNGTKPSSGDMLYRRYA